jgi:hypothetical protein
MVDKDDVVALLSWLSIPSPVPSVNGNGVHTLTKQDRQSLIDQAVWEEEDAQRGEPLVIPDIRDPRVRAEVRRVAAEQERRLEERLIAAGLHVLQKRRRIA